jgi:hypothetical protein
VLTRDGLVLDVGRMEALARWITPTAEPRRYDTRFYILPLPPGQHGAHDDHETTQSFWATPERILTRWAAGELFLAPPTTHTIELLGRAATVAEALALARSQSLRPVCPHFTQAGDNPILTLPGDPLHPEPSEPPEDADAPTRFVLRNGRFIAARA